MFAVGDFVGDSVVGFCVVGVVTNSAASGLYIVGADVNVGVEVGLGEQTKSR